MSDVLVSAAASDFARHYMEQHLQDDAERVKWVTYFLAKPWKWSDEIKLFELSGSCGSECVKR